MYLLLVQLDELILLETVKQMTVYVSFETGKNCLSLLRVYVK